MTAELKESVRTMDDAFAKLLDADTHPDSMMVSAMGNEQYACGVGFGSRHEDAVVFVMCDASVVVIKPSIELNVLYQLAGAIDGGKPPGY